FRSWPASCCSPSWRSPSRCVPGARRGRRPLVSRRNWYLLTNSVVLGWLVLTLVAVAVHRSVDRPLWLMVHVPLLGAVTAAILVWSQHFADTLTRRQAPIGRTGLGVRLALQTAGALTVTAGMLVDAMALVVAGASAIALAVLVHAVLLALQLRRALPARFAPLVRYYVAAALVFLGGIALGVAMWLLDSSEPTDRPVPAHILL